MCRLSTRYWKYPGSRAQWSSGVFFCCCCSNTSDESFPQANTKADSRTKEWKAMGTWPFILRGCQGLVNSTGGVWGGLSLLTYLHSPGPSPKLWLLPPWRDKPDGRGTHTCTHTSGIAHWVSCSFFIPQSHFLFCPFFHLSAAHEFTATFVVFSNDLSLLSRSWPLRPETGWFSSQSCHCTRVFLRE